MLETAGFDAAVAFRPTVMVRRGRAGQLASSDRRLNVGSLTWSLWGWSLPDGPDDRDLPELLGFGGSYLTSISFYLDLAELFAITLPAVVRGSALLEARFARALLSREN